jgi:hypothetical protein
MNFEWVSDLLSPPWGFIKKEPGVVISLLALAFTVSSFWWINARRGKIKCFAPHTFAAYLGDKSTCLLRFPFVIYNNGATPIIIENMRLASLDAEKNTMDWGFTRKTLSPGNNEDDKSELPAVFSVPGRTAVQLYIEFFGEFFEYPPQPRPYSVSLEVKVSHRKKWRTYTKFTLHIDHVKHPDVPIAYSNDPQSVTEQDRIEAKKAFHNIFRRAQ